MRPDHDVLLLLLHAVKSKGNAFVVCVPSILYCTLVLALRPATIFGFNVFLISHEVIGVLGEYLSITSHLCEH